MRSAVRFDWDFFTEYDAVIVLCHASYELERSKKIICNTPPGLPLQRGVISASIGTLKVDANYRQSLQELSATFAKLPSTKPPTNILTDRSELMQFLKELDAAMKGVSNSPNVAVLIDISVFPKDRLFLAVDYFVRSLPQVKIVLGYTEPKSYDTDARTDGWLSKGVVEVVSLPGFNGRQDPSKMSLLILNTGHENERMSITINNREPQKLVLIAQGDEQTSVLTGRYAQRLFNRIRSDYGAIVDEESIVKANSKDIDSVRLAILDVYAKFAHEYNISVAFLGTKIQAIGALLACQGNRSIEAVYAQPQIYHRERYSQGVGDSYMVFFN
jgi:hypothetical protein